MMEAAGVTEELKARNPMCWGEADEHAENTGGRNHTRRINPQLVFRQELLLLPNSIII